MTVTGDKGEVLSTPYRFSGVLTKHGTGKLPCSMAQLQSELGRDRSPLLNIRSRLAKQAGDREPIQW
jgi:hypothetical protein